MVLLWVSMHIFIVDSSHFHRSLLLTQLSQIVRSSLTSWEDGVDALSHYAKIGNDLESFLFLVDTQRDCRLGADFIKGVRRLERDKAWSPSSVLAMSEHETVSADLFTKLAGADGVLNKPVDRGDLYKEMRRSMGEEQVILASEL